MTLFLAIAITLYLVGFYNCLFMSKKNIISFLVASEVMFLGIDILFILSSLLFNIANGLIFGVLILMLSVGESALGLGLCVTSLKLNKNISFYDYSRLKC
jgi:NADH:ubiquinone oxidoreductase subunit K